MLFARLQFSMSRGGLFDRRGALSDHQASLYLLHGESFGSVRHGILCITEKAKSSHFLARLSPHRNGNAELEWG